MSYKKVEKETDLTSQVTISPLKDNSSNTDALVVTIRKLNAPSKEVTKDATPSKQPNITMPVAPKTSNKETMTEIEKPMHENSKLTESIEHVPCPKHAAQNIALKATNIPSDKLALCSPCSKSMLSYIFVVQDFLSSLAKEISGDSDPNKCIHCIREELTLTNLNSSPQLDNSKSRERNQLSASREQNSRSEPGTTDYASRYARQDSDSHRRKEGGTRRQKRYTTDSPHDVRKKDEQSRSCDNFPPQQSYRNGQAKQVDFPNIPSPRRDMPKRKDQSISNDQSNVPPHFNEQKTVNNGNLKAESGSSNENKNYSEQKHVTEMPMNQHHKSYEEKREQHYEQSSDDQPQHRNENRIFVFPLERTQPENIQVTSPYVQTSSNKDNSSGPSFLIDSHRENFSAGGTTPSLFGNEVDGIVSTLSNAEREVYDTARDRAGWERSTEPQESLGPSPSGEIASEAYVTMCRNNAEALGCLVLGTSLLLCRTSRTLCVLVSDGVSTAFRTSLSSVFNVVQYVRSLDSLGTTKLALLEQPELGISFDKLNIWRLTQFNKCVYLNPDTLVIQNCDELFYHEELSAVPDVGWPDCFNSGVFVFSPSSQTFWKLVEFAENQGSYDGGDQGLMNTYFSSWSSDITKKLSFIYNLMANVSYTYTPAFRQFGRNVKIVQFLGSFKPWHVKFYTGTGQIAPASAVHPTYVQFVHIWLNIFRISVLRLLPQEIQSYSASQKVICATELLRFFPLPLEAETDFYLTPPSVRLRLIEKPIELTVADRKRRQSAEFQRAKPNVYTRMRSASTEEAPNVSELQQSEIKTSTEGLVFNSNKDASEKTLVSEVDNQSSLTSSQIQDTNESSDILQENVPTGEVPTDENALPGSEVGDYQGMKAWEQGRMDYQGNDSSENIIKRLEFLMSQPK